MSISENLASIQEKIHRAEARAGRPAGSATLIAVSKTFPIEDIITCHQAGQTIFGENRVQEALSKIPSLSESVEWHLIGPLQRNKVRKALPSFSLIHSVDSLQLARFMDQVAKELGLTPSILLEIHLGGEQTKFGFTPDELIACWDELCQLGNIRIQGLMCIPPPVDDPEQARPFFRSLRELRNHLVQKGPLQLPELSMGMSHDFEVAVEEGATLVRVGSAIFGYRNYPM